MENFQHIYAMKTVGWFLHVLLIFVFLGAGFSKLFTPYTNLNSQPGMEWVNEFSPIFISFVSVMEIVGAFGLFLPLLVKKYEFLVPISAIMLGVVMVLAMILHITRNEPFFINIMLLVLAMLVALLRKDLMFRRVR